MLTSKGYLRWAVVKDGIQIVSCMYTQIALAHASCIGGQVVDLLEVPDGD